MHVPVLLKEVLEYLDPKPNENFIDCTVGEGGHALAILKLIAPNGIVLGIDRDADMVTRLRESAERLGISDRITIHQGNFADIREIVESHKFGQVRGVLFDFGMSSWQLDGSGAGFSFQNVEPLDMRFDRTKDTETAASILNSWPEESIGRVIYEFGEERYARRIAKEIVAARKKERIKTTDQLVGIIGRAVARNYGGRKIHFATRTFQALRIAVNSELTSLEKGINEAVSLLPSGGRIAAVSFHSLEDRRVKNIFKGSPSVKVITKKPIGASKEEIGENPRARSAKLRVAEKI
ncbi:MAG: 16S rRNA (cytosine(1402)-N(4))-methyltransferase RsmH [Candidatus Spechtbacterales bacterium]